MPVTSTATHTATITRKRVKTRRRLSASAFCGLRSEAAQVVDDVPDILVWHLSFEADHLGRTTGAVEDHAEDLIVGRSVDPRGIRQVRRVRVLRGERAVPLGVHAMAERTILLIGGCARGDRSRRRRHRALFHLSSCSVSGGPGVGCKCEQHRSNRDESADQLHGYLDFCTWRTAPATGGSPPDSRRTTYLMGS